MGLPERYNTRLFLPTSVKEMKLLGWDHVDVVIFPEMLMLIIPLSGLP